MSSSKRAAGRELNHDNWNDEEEGEDAGEFKKATEDELKNRIRKVAKRRIGDSETNGTSSNPFGGFSGFGGFKTNTGFSTSTPATASVNNSSSPFSFLAKIPSTTAAAAKPVNGTSEPSLSQPGSGSSEYLSKIKALNIAVSDWIKEHVDENPICLLTPVFKDYERYIKEFEELKKKPTNTSEVKKSEPKDTAPAPAALSTFSFGKTSTVPISSSLSSNSKSSSTFSSITFGTTSPPKPTADLPKPAESPKSTFSFGSTGALASQPTFSFGLTSQSSSIFGGTSSSFSGFGSAPSTEAPKTAGEEEADEEPPKNDFVAVVEDDSLYSKRCKVFVKSDKGDYADRGVGMLFIKKVEDKIQMIVRADTNLGNILLNIMLVEGLPTSRMGKNNVMIVCVPTPEANPPPTSVLVRVKTGDEADDLLEQINKYKK